MLTLALLPALIAPAAASDPPLEPGRLQLDMRKGVRLGYVFVNLQDGDALRSPHLSVFGDFIAVENLSVTGIEQGLFRPSLNLLIGFEFQERLQVGAGAHVQPMETEDQALRLQLVVGGTVPAGDLEVPIHVGFIPDPDGRWRAQLTTGVYF